MQKLCICALGFRVWYQFDAVCSRVDLRVPEQALRPAIMKSAAPEPRVSCPRTSHFHLHHQSRCRARRRSGYPTRVTPTSSASCSAPHPKNRRRAAPSLCESSIRSVYKLWRQQSLSTCTAALSFAARSNARRQGAHSGRGYPPLTASGAVTAGSCTACSPIKTKSTTSGLL